MGVLDDAAKAVQAEGQQARTPSTPPAIPQPIVSPATDQRPASNSVAGAPGATFHGLTQDQANAMVVPTPASATSGSLLDQAAAQVNAEDTPPQHQPGNTGGASGDWDNHYGAKLWDFLVKDVVPEGKAEKQARAIAEAAPSKDTTETGKFLGGTYNESRVAGLKAGVAGAYADTAEFVRSLTSPLALATMELGVLGEAAGKAGTIAKATSRLVGAGFTYQAAKQTIDGIQDLLDNGVSPQGLSTALQGGAQTALGAAATLHEFGGKAKPKAESERTTIRPTTKTIADQKVPITAAQQENPSILTRAAAALAEPGKATEFQKEQTIPAAKKAAMSTLSQVVTDKTNAHKALVNGEAAPEEITGTQTPGEHETPEQMWPAMQDATQPTWDKARSVSADEQAAWHRERIAAEQAHQEGIDHYNSLVDAHNADPANADNRVERQEYNPADVDVRERPKTFDELKADVDTANNRLNDPSTDVRQKAMDSDIPKAEKALDGFFKDHEDTVSSAEYESAKKLWADSMRFKQIDLSLSRKLATGNLTGNDIRGLEAVIDNSAKRRRGAAGIGEFKRLLGPDAYSNLRNVAKLFDPVESTNPLTQQMKSWGNFITKQILGGGLGYHFGGGAGLVAGEGISNGFSWLLKKALFDPEFGSSFVKFGNAVKDAFSSGTRVPANIVEGFRNVLGSAVDKYKASRLGGEEGAVSAGGVKRANVGPQAGEPTPRPKTWPTDDDLLQKFGEANDPAQTAFLLTDGRKVAQRGTEHDYMLGGKPTDDFRTPYVNETGNIRMRAYGSYGDRQFSFSLPKSGITEAQLDEIKKWGPQLRTGRVFIEQADANGKNVVLHNATNDQLEEGIRSVVPIKEAAKPDQIAAHNANGGSTFDAQGNDMSGADKWAVGERPDLSEQVTGKLTPEKLQAFKEKVDHVLDENHGVGTWEDPDTGKTHLDVSRLISDRDQAVEAAKRSNQKAIYHLGTGETLATGGTGEVPANGAIPVYSKELKAALGENTKRGEQAWKDNKNFRLTDAAGKPIDAFFSVAPEGLITGVINNSDTRGLMPRILDIAKKNGGTEGMVWDGNTSLMQNYKEAGFVPDRHEAYDEARFGKPSQQTKDYWSKKLGWKEGDPYPGVTYTRLQGGTAAGAAADTDFYAKAKAEEAAGELAPGMSVPRRAQELKDAAKVAPPQDNSASEITTRRPKAVGADLGNNPNQHANYDAIEQAGLNNPSGKTALGKAKMGYKEKLARTVAAYTGVNYTPEELANPDKVLSKFVNHVAGNLEWLYNQVPEEIRGRTRQWYDAANKVVSAKAKSYGFTPEQGAGVTAALSPQNPWDNNLGLANRVMDVYQNRQNFPYSPEMEQKAAELKKVPTQTAAFKGLLRDIAGKKLSEVKNANPDVQAVQRALWIRLYDEAHGNPVNDQYAPTGEVVGHSPDTRSWIGLDHVGKAVKILENGSVTNINDVMGQGHKIRNFYNNIINPNSKAGHVTIDTHATAAGQLQPFGAKDTETSHTFGGTTKGTPGAPRDASTGLQGTYPLYAEAYQRVARKLGILPRELQSVTWEAIKSLMGDEKKTPELKSEVKEIWQQVQEGKLTPEQARDRIKNASNGFSKPAWMSDEEWEKLGPEGEDTSFSTANEQDEEPDHSWQAGHEPEPVVVGNSGPEVKRAADFRETGEYDVTVDGVTHKIYRDPESKYWFENVPGKHFSETSLGNSKDEALARIMKRYGGQ